MGAGVGLAVVAGEVWVFLVVNLGVVEGVMAGTLGRAFPGFTVIKRKVTVTFVYTVKRIQTKHTNYKYHGFESDGCLMH